MNRKMILIAMAAGLFAGSQAFGAGMAKDSDMKSGSSGIQSSEDKSLSGEVSGDMGRDSEFSAMESAEITKDPAAVRKLQQALSDKGYDLEVDGQWGSNTKNALKQFQESNGMKGTGQLNAKTIDALGLSNEAEFSAFQAGDAARDKPVVDDEAGYSKPPSKGSDTGSMDYGKPANP